MLVLNWPAATSLLIGRFSGPERDRTLIRLDMERLVCADKPKYEVLPIQVSIARSMFSRGTYAHRKKAVLCYRTQSPIKVSSSRDRHIAPSPMPCRHSKGKQAEISATVDEIYKLVL